MKHNSRWTPPALMHITRSTQSGREGWSAVYEVVPGLKGKRVVGSLITEYRGRRTTPSTLVLPAETRLVRDHFDVALKKDGTFAVDIGTGSGVKIRFALGVPTTQAEPPRDKSLDDFLAGVEFGVRQAEKGSNLQLALKNALLVAKGEPKETKP